MVFCYLLKNEYQLNDSARLVRDDRNATNTIGEVNLKLLLKLAVLGIVVTTSACTSFQPKLTDELKSDIASVRVISVIHQEELNVQMNASTGGTAAAASFGLIGALVGSIADASVNSARSKAAEEKAERFRAVLSGSNSTAAINTTLRESVESVDWAETNFVPYQDSEEFKTANLNGVLEDMEEDALIVLYSSYSLTPELESLEIATRLALYKRPDQTAKDGPKRNRVLYQSGMKYQSKLYGGRYRSNTAEELEQERAAIIARYDKKIANAARPDKKVFEKRKRKLLESLNGRSFVKVKGEVDTEGTAWLEEDGELLKNTLEAGIAELGKLLVLDLEDPLSPADYKSTKQKFSTVTMTGGKKTTMMTAKTDGWLLDRAESRQRIRLVDGFIYSVDENDFLRPLSGLRQ